jgi:4-oxalocrotonate tautomerase
MSTINVQLFEELFDGRRFEQKRAFVTAFTEANCVTTDCGAESVDITFQDAGCEDSASAGKRWTD